MSTAAKKQRTQWTAQFLVASELVRRGYTVAFTMGNHTPLADLTVGTASGRQFWVDVKGVSSDNSWFLNPKNVRDELYYVLTRVVLPDEKKNKADSVDSFFILTEKEVSKVVSNYQKNKPKPPKSPGCGFKDVFGFRDKWDTLPKADDK